MKKSLIFSLFFVFSVTYNVNAQKIHLTEKDKEEFKQKAIGMIEFFKESLTIIPTYSDTIIKQKAIRNTLRMFTNDATIEIAYASGKVSNPILLNDYLNSLKKYSKKNELVQIDIIDFTVDDIEPHPTELGKYVINYKFVQRFRKKKNYMPNQNPEKLESFEWDYIDVTTKNGIAIVAKHTDMEGTQWVLLLGDIKVNGIEVTKK